jgi:uncharacterized membrane protein
MRGWKDIFLVFKIFMSLVYLVMGILILFSDVIKLPIINSGRIILGLALVLYGIFRMYSKVINSKSDEE